MDWTGSIGVIGGWGWGVGEETNGKKVLTSTYFTNVDQQGTEASKQATRGEGSARRHDTRGPNKTRQGELGERAWAGLDSSHK